MNMNMDFIKGFLVGIAVLILYVFLQPQTGRYVFKDGDYNHTMLDTKTGQTYHSEGKDRKWKKQRGLEKE